MDLNDSVAGGTAVLPTRIVALAYLATIISDRVFPTDVRGTGKSTS